MSEKVDANGALSATENALRNLIGQALSVAYGQNWETKIGVTQQRLDTWYKRKDEERKKLSTDIESRLLYFSDFTDLETILSKHWQLFSSVFPRGKKEMEIFLSVLEGYRNPDAHRRRLLPFQEHLVVGICGQIRSEITRFRSKRESSSDYFPQIDNAFDNHGQLYPFRLPPIEGYARKVSANGDIQEVTLRTGDYVEIVVSASDPEGNDLLYSFTHTGKNEEEWQNIGSFSLDLTKKHIGMLFAVTCKVKSLRDYHASGGYDDEMNFLYTVLPQS